MAFLDEAVKGGRRPFVIVEIDMDYCQEVEGTSPCTSLAGGDEKCTNTFVTCNDTPNYNKGAKTYKFSDIALPGQGIYPFITRVDTAPTEITPGKGLGVRANCKVIFTDAIDSDIGIDPAVNDRSIIATERGTFWGKFFARNPYYYGREVRVKYGMLDDAGGITNVETFTYIIDKFEYQSRTQTVSLMGKDHLTLGDNVKGKTPKATTGKTTGALNAGATVFSVGTGEGAEYAASGRIAIDKEIMSYTRATDTFTVTRGQQGTTAKSHSSGATVQEVRYWDAESVSTVLQDLLETDAGIPPSKIPIVDWQAEDTQWLSSYSISRNIIKPVEINKLVGELMQQCSFSIWADDRDSGKIKFAVEAPLLGSELALANTYTDADIIENTLTVVDDSKSRASAVWVHHTVIDPAEGSGKVSNYEATEGRGDAALAGENAYNQEQYKEIYSDWLRLSTPASLTATRYLARFKNPPKKVNFKLDASAKKLQVGDHFFLRSAALQDKNGNENTLEFQCVSLDYDPVNTTFNIKALQFRFSADRQCVVAPNTQVGYLIASDSERTAYGFICDEATGKMSNGDDPYLVV
ncbi:hypothetical protein [uncultured Paraglaciecola sp.]|uniref:hypothetical protein n=1 Tax=uncultured Paraglaciecola sp. TaxID=1765024 RepID=UPI00263020CA|nr:hypothetical protein [uncultured Paraglaciecola sp.]